MSSVPQLLPLEKNDEIKRKEVLTNIVKMLTNRKLLNKENLVKNIDELIIQQSDDNVYKIKLDYPEVYYTDKDTYYYIKILNQKITGISKTSNIGDFLFSKKSAPKLIIASSISNKPFQQLKNEFLNAEVFTEQELMMDLVSHIIVPHHEMLSSDETKIFLEDYFLKKREIPKMTVFDPVAKYYNARVGQVFRIIRPSETSVQSIYYRIVIDGSLSDERQKVD